MANSEKEPFQLRTLFTGYEKLGTVITNLFANFISSPVILFIASIIIFVWSRHDGYGMSAVLAFIFALWMIAPPFGWLIRSSNVDREGFYEVISGACGVIGLLVCLFVDCIY